MNTKMPERPLGTTGYSVSRIGLGTVEIGLAYGIVAKEVPSEKEAEHILKSAVEMGITYIDTARGYGLAEERIGKSGVSTMEGVLVGTKCAQFLKDEPDLHGTELEKRIRDEIDESRRLLKLETLPLVQLHIELPDFTDLRELAEIMSKLKAEEIIAHVGIACRGHDVPTAAMDTEFFETLQVAYSILDQRLVAVLERAKKENVGIINRSVLLKGALTPKAENLPDALGPLKSNSAKAAKIADELGMTLPTLAMRFVLSNSAVSTALIGTRKPHHLQSAIDAAKAGPLPTEVLTRLHELAIDDPLQVDPAQWPPL